ncbi:MAG: hypothetical protein IKP64_00085 [Selenomonadaceae bacterium]|nr:hypothetical protein [Selenomonadaceae bacterium]
MRIETILQYYAFISLVTLPLNALAFLYVYKKTDYLDRFNDWLDRILKLGEPIKTPQALAQEEKTEKEPETFASREEYERKGTSFVRIQVGDIYYCRLTSRQTDSRLYQLDWYSNNEFVGQIDENAIFSAFHTGRATVGYFERGNSLNGGNPMYEIEVIPTEERWFADEFVPAILEHRKKDVVLASLIDRRILSENTQARSLTYEGRGEYKKLTIQFNIFGELDKVLYELPEGGGPSDEDISKKMEERYDEAKLKGQGIRIWYSLESNRSKEDVKLYAFLRQDGNGSRLFGISQFWRQNAEIDEFLLNIQMAEKYFSDLLPGIIPIEVEVEYEEEPAAQEPSRQRHEGRPDQTGGSADGAEDTENEVEEAENTDRKPSDNSPEGIDEENDGPDQGSVADPSEMPEISVPSEDEEEEGGDGQENKTPDVLDFDEQETSRLLDDIDDFNE